MSATASREKQNHWLPVAGFSYLTEAVLWGAGLLVLALMEPTGNHLFSLCPWSWIGIHFCPGCGLGHAIAFLVRGEWQASWQAHPLALPAVALLLWRVKVLVRQFIYLKTITLN